LAVSGYFGEARIIPAGINKKGPSLGPFCGLR